MRTGRALLSLFLLWHLLAMTGSALRGSTFGDAIREVTRPYEKLVGVHQNWGMFVHPARSTNWLRAVGGTPDGEVDLPVVHGEPVGPNLVYARENKFDRTALGPEKKALRRGYTRYLCGQHDVQWVRFERAFRATPPPGERGTAARHDWPIDTEVLGQEDCK